MAGLEKRGESFRIFFRFRGKQRTLPLGKVSAQEADAKASQVDYLLLRLKQRLIELPPGVGIVEFLQYDGKPPDKSNSSPSVPQLKLVLSDLKDRYLKVRGEALESRTLDTARLHFKHLCAILRDSFPIRELTLNDLQGYVDRRGKQKTSSGKRLSPTTVKKEVVTLRTAWNWAVKMGLASGRFPYDGLSYPKTDEKPPFMTREEIERRTAVEKLTGDKAKELWESLYLRKEEMAEMLAVVRQSANHAWIYPLTCMAAHTGARRSELAQMQRVDLDIAGGTILIREKKRVKGKRSTRRAPLTPQLTEALQSWLAIHPGGNILFCHSAEVARSKKRSPTTGHQSGESRSKSLKGRLATVQVRTMRQDDGPLTVREIHDHFKRALAGSKWNVVRGLHVLRHSFISALVASGIDQRIIDDIVGHTSEEMRRRYRHLTPQLKSQAVISVFG